SNGVQQVSYALLNTCDPANLLGELGGAGCGRSENHGLHSPVVIAFSQKLSVEQCSKLSVSVRSQLDFTLGVRTPHSFGIDACLQEHIGQILCMLDACSEPHSLAPLHELKPRLGHLHVALWRIDSSLQFILLEIPSRNLHVIQTSVGLYAKALQWR